MAIIKKRIQITNVGKDVEKKEPLYTVSGNVNWCSHCGKHHGDSSKTLKAELLCDPVIPFLGVYRRQTKTVTQKNKCTLCSLQHYLQSQDMEATKVFIIG